MTDLRVIFDPPASGPWNMAVDEALLETAAATGLATLRFYAWSEPTLSLGYFQAAEERAQHPASCSCPLVRRASGGGAIVHDRELTYGIAWPQLAPRGRTAGELYIAVHETLAETLRELGVAATLYRPPGGRQAVVPDTAEPFLCFLRRASGDIVCDGAKIAGSAQRRRRGAVLQHGSILLDRSEHAPELPGIWQLAPKGIDPHELAHRWERRILAATTAASFPDGLQPQERQRAEELVLARFASPKYTLRR